MVSDQWIRSWASFIVSPKASRGIPTPPLHLPLVPYELINVFAPSAVPEFRALVGNEAAEELQCSVGDAVHTRLVLKNCFTRMMNCEKKVFVDQLNMLVKRVTEEGEEYQNRFYTTLAEPKEGKVGVCFGPSGTVGCLLSGRVSGAVWEDI